MSVRKRIVQLFEHAGHVHRFLGHQGLIGDYCAWVVKILLILNGILQRGLFDFIHLREFYGGLGLIIHGEIAPSRFDWINGSSI